MKNNLYELSDDDIHMILLDIFNSKTFENTFNSWSCHPDSYSRNNFRESIRYLQPAHRGALYRKLVETFFKECGFHTIGRELGYCDISIDGYDHEIKGSIYMKKGLTINHIKPDANFVNLIFLAFTKNNLFRMYFFPRESIKEHFIPMGYLKNGKRLNINDHKMSIRNGDVNDYSVSGKNVDKIIASDYCKSINKWSVDTSNMPKRRTLFNV